MTKTNEGKDRAIVKYLNTKAWAITREALDTIQEVVSNHMSGMEVRLESSTKARVLGSVKHPDVAVIPMHGTVAKKFYGLEAISGGETTIEWQNRIQEALNDDRINAIVLDIDSPGGTVDGTKELADFIYNAREVKPIIAYANGLMASAAYWIGSAASKIVAFDTTQVGSIGVIVSHRDYSEREKMMGVKTTHIYAGKYKALASSSHPLDEASEKYLQESVDYYYTLFVDSVAKHRGVAIPTVLEKMAEGRVFIGQQSKEVGLVDLIGNLEDAINLAKEGGTKVTIQDAVKEFGAKNLLAHLVATCGAEIPQQVVSAYEEATKPVVELPAEVSALVEELRSKVASLEQDKIEAEQKIQEERAANEKKEKERAIQEKLKGVKLQDDAKFVEIAMKVEEEVLDAFVGHIAQLQLQISEVSGELFEESDGATSQSTHMEDAPNTFDSACGYVAKRDNIDIDEAISVAAKEFPSLYGEHIKGGN